MKITGITPWLVRVPSPYSYQGPAGELLFVQVTTDEGITGWGEVTTTYPVANRATRAVLEQMGEFLEGEDPTRIEAIWQKIFRAFTYTGSRGMTTNVISGTGREVLLKPTSDADIPNFEAALCGGDATTFKRLFVGRTTNTRDNAAIKKAAHGTLVEVDDPHQSFA